MLRKDAIRHPQANSVANIGRSIWGYTLSTMCRGVKISGVNYKKRISVAISNLYRGEFTRGKRQIANTVTLIKVDVQSVDLWYLSLRDSFRMYLVPNPLLLPSDRKMPTEWSNYMNRRLCKIHEICRIFIITSCTAHFRDRAPKISLIFTSKRANAMQNFKIYILKV